jgi:hypothetical protein
MRRTDETKHCLIDEGTATDLPKIQTLAIDLVTGTNEMTVRKEALAIIVGEPYKQTYDVYGNTGRSIPLERQFSC